MDSHLSRKVLITCEHAGYHIPKKYRKWFRGAESVLKSHRGWDPGALKLAETLSESWKVPLLSYRFSRLLIEPNRSEHHHQLYSEYTRKADKEIKMALLEYYYRPYRDKVYKAVRDGISQSGNLLHISIHTFTPVLHGKIRDFDIGLLYDPKRGSEKMFATGLKAGLSEIFQIRMNRPYKGTSDGLVTTLRKHFHAEQYIGLELEINQKHYEKGDTEWNKICKQIAFRTNLLIQNVFDEKAKR